jgi:hypothetical protein
MSKASFARIGILRTQCISYVTPPLDISESSMTDTRINALGRVPDRVADVCPKVRGRVMDWGTDGHWED